MGLTGKLSAQIEYNSSGDVFHKLFRYMPHEISKMSPNLVQGCDLHEGEWGSLGSIIVWKYTHEGKEKLAKEIVEYVDEEKKLITLKVIEGDVLELYKIIKVTFHVETNGDIDSVTWILEYEKHNDDVEDPLTILGLLINIARDIESHHLKGRR